MQEFVEIILLQVRAMAWYIPLKFFLSMIVMPTTNKNSHYKTQTIDHG